MRGNTMSPEDQKTSNVIYFGVEGKTTHVAGTFLPSSTYDITAKVYRYRVESTLLEMGGLTEDRRYSVVTMDNFNYYEVKLTPATYSVEFKTTVHYGEVSVYTSSSTLPTQDTDIGADSAATNIDTATNSAGQTVTIPVSNLNLVDGYVYVGIIGRTSDSSYDIEVTLTQVNSGLPPTKVYNCVDKSDPASPVRFVGTQASCLFADKLPYLPEGTTFLAYHLSQYVNQDMSVTERSAAGSPILDSDSGTDGFQTDTEENTWGTDWTETAINTWVDDYTDELNLDIDLQITTPAAGTDRKSVV